MSLDAQGVAVSRPMNLAGSTRDFSPEDLYWIASEFDVGPITGLEYFVERGNINLHTFFVQNEEGGGFLLQRLNTDVFTNPYRLMDTMQEWIRHQSASVASRGVQWVPITLVPTRSGAPYLDLSDESGLSVWRTMVRITDTLSYKSLGQVPTRTKSLNLAEETGRGLALNSDLVSEMPTDQLVSSLPGYRDTAGYFKQFHSVLAGNFAAEDVEHLLPASDEVRHATASLYRLALDPAEAERRREDPELAPYIEQILADEQWAMGLQQAVQAGEVRQTAVHGDTKIENFLFCKYTGQVRSLVDLDTIMPYTWLADWGDMVRSLANVAGEKEPDTKQIQVDKDVYAAVTRGFLSTAQEATPAETALMPEAVETIATELGVRFLTDYLRGDNYFLLGPEDPADLNKTRGIGQLTLARRLRELRPWARDTVRQYSR
ncbi:MAG: phosphotransferase [Fimbriimonadaceae bacterium]|nr:phosphotransferase [Fimbriimonadaceae bacterium]